MKNQMYGQDTHVNSLKEAKDLTMNKCINNVRKILDPQSPGQWSSWGRVQG